MAHCDADWSRSHPPHQVSALPVNAAPGADYACVGLVLAYSVEKLEGFAALYHRRMCSRLCFTRRLWLEFALVPVWLAF
jgi:hypothetical protein